MLMPFLRFSCFFFADIIADSPSSRGSGESAATDRNGPIASIDEIDEIDQFVKPSKIHVQPLHADDLLYESKKFDPSAGKYSSTSEYHHMHSMHILLFLPIIAVSRE